MPGLGASTAVDVGEANTQTVATHRTMRLHSGQQQKQQQTSGRLRVEEENAAPYDDAVAHLEGLVPHLFQKRMQTTMMSTLRVCPTTFPGIGS
mmetsp:Transcript_14230/g.56726  ORF Transcript_14230/g.56726 Transcript_14230/m.56726 type:complete len:93 (-) Transcript_14230:1233-1511(-)